MPDDRPFVPFATIAEPLGRLLIAMGNLLKREWPRQFCRLPSAKGVLRGVFAQARVTYGSVVFLCGDRPEVSSRLPEYVVSAQPLARTILDSVFLVVFLLEDFPTRIEWYCKAGIIDLERDHEQHIARYGDNPMWNAWLWNRSLAILTVRQGLEFTPDTPDQAKRRPRWPHPGGMISATAKRQGWLSNESDAFLMYLHDWFYRELSWATHLTFPGVLNASVRLLDIVDEDRRVEGLAKHKSDAMMTTLTLLLALASEVQVGLQFDRAEQCREVWRLLAPVWGPADELYERRYSAKL